MARTGGHLAGSEAAPRANRARQAILLALSDELRPLADPAEVQATACRVVGEHLETDRTYYVELDPVRGLAVVARDHVRGDAPSLAGAHPLAAFSAALDEMRAGRPFVGEDAATDARIDDADRPAYLARAIHAWVSVPLIKGGELVAALCVTSGTPRTWAPQEVALLEEVAERTWEAAERARTEMALRASEARLQLALDVAELGTWEIDLATGHATLDARGAEIVGLQLEHVDDAARAQEDRVHPDDLARLQAEVAAGAAAGTPFKLTYRVVLHGGDVRHIASRARVLTDAAGRAVQLVGTNRDVTTEHVANVERARLLAAERAAREEAEAANRAKSEFLAVMSHELRTPLNAIQGYAELMELGIYGLVTPEQRESLRRIQTSQRHLLGLVNGVLNYARVETGNVDYRVTDVPLDELLATCAALIAPQARARRLTLRFVGAAHNLVALADPEKLQQIVLNLLSNAVKFTEPGGTVALSAEAAEDGDQRVVRVAVRDTGRGIPAEQLGRIFEPFVQLDARLTRTQHGTGLGLAISRDLARGMGGDLTAESTSGVGSTFSLTLPRGSTTDS